MQFTLTRHVKGPEGMLMRTKKKQSEAKNIDEKNTGDTKNIEPGMAVEAPKGDLGEEDVSKPKVTEVVQDRQGNVDKLVVKKGVIFKKTLEIPADRVQSIDQEDGEVENAAGKIVVDVSNKEAASLTSAGTEALKPEEEHNLLDKVEHEVPTAEGLRKLEASKKSIQEKQTSIQPAVSSTIIPSEGEKLHAGRVDEASHAGQDKKSNFLLHVLGPGFLAGMAGNDA